MMLSDHMRNQNGKFMTSYIRLLGGGILLLSLSACLSPMALDRAVTAYDEAIVMTEARQLLANIARAQHRCRVNSKQKSSG